MQRKVVIDDYFIIYWFGLTTNQFNEGHYNICYFVWTTVVMNVPQNVTIKFWLWPSDLHMKIWGWLLNWCVWYVFYVMPCHAMSSWAKFACYSGTGKASDAYPEWLATLEGTLFFHSGPQSMHQPMHDAKLLLYDLLICRYCMFCFMVLLPNFLSHVNQSPPDYLV